VSHLHYITGAAGTGKTHELSNALLRWFEHHSLMEHQMILALTKMHGSRKRLIERLATNSIHAQLKVSTIDSFALNLVNRWRLSLGYVFPIVPTLANGGFVRDELGLRATFDEIRDAAASILESTIVARTISNSYPLILVDEFQDCVGNQLSIIGSLANHVDLILAADPFQALDGDESACDWVGELEGQEHVDFTRLIQPRRTDNRVIQEAASALYENRPANYRGGRLPFFSVPTYDLAPWKIIPARLGPNENAALIFPALRAFTNLSKSVIRQNGRRAANGQPQIFFPWIQRLNDKDYEQTMLSDFLREIEQGTWKNDKKWQNLHQQAFYLAKVKGYDQPPSKFLENVVTTYVQSRKYVNARSVKYESTTIHGAKNREFDHVYVIWDDRLIARLSDDEKRRLLYNAITRAKHSCKVVAIGAERNVMTSPVLSLLGIPQGPNQRR
jgi:superfamily I DNA/RNA helicase